VYNILPLRISLRVCVLTLCEKGEAMKINDLYLLHTKARLDLLREIEDELQQEDPEEATAIIKKHEKSNSESDRNNSTSS